MKWFTVVVGCSNGIPRSPWSSAQSQWRYCLQIGSSSPYFRMMFAIPVGGSGCWVTLNGPPGTACMSPKMTMLTMRMTSSSVRNRCTR